MPGQSLSAKTSPHNESPHMLRLLALLSFLAFPAMAQPNIILILADDFSMNLMPAATGPTHMPNLRQMQQDGMTFTHSFTVNSLCCPSRASTFTGMLPHNTGVEANNPPNGGLDAWLAHGNDAKSFALPLQAAGYETAFMGKYLNGWEPLTSPIPPGWNRWVATGHDGYAGFDYALSIDGVVSYPADHMTDQISALGRQFVNQAEGPFFLELAPFSVHAPFTPPTRYAADFADYVLPKTPAYGARPDPAAPAWLQAIPPLVTKDHNKFQRNYLDRVRGAKAIDEMIGRIRNRLDINGLAANTYVIFTSDNGFHMGEMSMRNGKMTPFDFDARVPFVVVGPGIAPGSVSDEIIMNIDLAPTFLDLAGAPPSATVDGRSMVPLFAGGTSSRTVAVIEHSTANFDPDDPDTQDPRAGEPPPYTALRGANWLYVEYFGGEIGYYTDPHQLANTAASLTPEQLAALHAKAVANATCAGAVQCGAAQD